MKAPGIKLLKLKYDEPLSNFAFNFNLRRCTVGNDDYSYGDYASPDLDSI